MDIFKFAKQMEKEGEGYYRDLAKKTAVPGLREILTMLADSEVNHYRVFQNMEKQLPCKLPNTPFLSSAKAVFAQMKGEQKLIASDQTQIALYRKALDIEETSRDFYIEKAKQLENHEQKAVLMKIADQEKQHYQIVDNMIDLILAPELWLENAEWHHLDEY